MFARQKAGMAAEVVGHRWPQEGYRRQWAGRKLRGAVAEAAWGIRHGQRQVRGR